MQVLLRSSILGVFVAVGGVQAALALETHFNTPGATDELRDLLKNASLVREAAARENADAQDYFAAAQADYGQLIGVLYDQGYYSGTISIRVDGREAAAIDPIDTPASINKIVIRVEPGPLFHFAHAAIGPLAQSTELPDGYHEGEVAYSGVIAEAATAGVDGWRAKGHAKAAVSDQKVVADHRAKTLSSDIALEPGPSVILGDMHISGNKRLRTERLAAIAGFPTGERFSPDKLDTVRARLRRTGIFSSTTLTEAETLRDGNVLDTDLQVVEAKKRRIGFGAELASTDGLTLSGYWLHRNLWGGGEKFRIDGEISGIGGATGGNDYSLKARIDRPATFTPDTTVYVESEIKQEHEDFYDLRGFTVGFGLTHIINPRLTGSVGIGYNWGEVDFGFFDWIYREVNFPLGLVWDNRDDPTDATRGYYGDLTFTPFYGLSNTGTGAQLVADLRTYRAFGEDSRFVIAGRAQVGAVFGSSALETPNDYLFYSGGGGTVRGQPYQSLGVEWDHSGYYFGGTRFLGLSGELRAGITKSIGAVAFYDAGYISDDEFFSDTGVWHSGAGLGLRYKTPIGPIRLDIAAPVDGDTGDGVQVYIGIGQAF